MTADEKREQKGMLLLECQEAEEELAHLSEKALRVSETLKQISDDLVSSCPSKHGGFSIREDDEPTLLKTDPQFKAALDIDALIVLLSDLNKAKRKVRGLQDRKSSLGLK